MAVAITRRGALQAFLVAAVLPGLLFCVSRGGSFEAPRRRAVLVSFDAVAGERLARLMEDPSKLSAGGYRRIAERGLFARGSVPPTPSLTAVSHITHVTGALPQVTGIVSNWMLDPAGPFGATLSGFDAPIRAETLWEAARRQGKRVGVILYPGADGKIPARSADWAMTWPAEAGLARAQMHTVEISAWRTVENPSSGSFSTLRRLTIAFPRTSHGVSFLALDRSDDGRVNYDGLRVETEAGGATEVRPGDWFPVEVKSEEGRTGAWCKLLALAPDLSKAEIYLGGLFRNTGYPKEFVRRLDARIGFWPGPPDGNSFGAGSARPDVFLEQVDRLAEFLMQADLFALARSDWDLLLFYHPQVDQVSHEFLLVDPRQPGYAAERVARFAAFFERGYALADRTLAAIEKALSSGDSIFVTSDHGMTPIWSEIYPNEILRQAGFVRLDADRRIDPSSDAVAVTSGAIAHVYLNKTTDRAALDEIETLFRNFRVKGTSPFDRIVRRQHAGPLGLNAPESGDLIVLGKPGFEFSRSVREREGPVGVPENTGAHGYLNVYPDLYASFLAAGPGIPRERVGLIGSWEIAARVSRALGMEPPRQAARARVF